MINLKASTQIAQPVQQVFDFVSSPENDPQWQTGTLAAASLPTSVGKIGSFFRSIGHSLGHRMQGIFEVTEYEPNLKYGFKSHSGLLHFKTSYTFEAIDPGTRINVSTQGHVVNFFHMNERFVENQIMQQMKEDLALLKGVLEATPSLYASR